MEEQCIYSNDELQLIAKQALNAGVTEQELTLRAAKAVVKTLEQEYISLKRVLVVVGKGKNGQAGCAVAQLLLAKGIQVLIWVLISTPSIEQQTQLLVSKGATLVQNLTNCDLIIDAIFGLGFKGTLSPVLQDVFIRLNQSKVPILALDVPSGLAEGKNDPSQIIHATQTVTFIAHKISLINAPFLTGKVHIAALNLNLNKVNRQFLNYRRIDWQPLQRLSTSHKYHFGPLAIFSGMTGAAILTTAGALRVGAGLVKVFLKEPVALNVRFPEAITFAKNEELETFFKKNKAAVIGLGIGRRKDWLSHLNSETPTVLDADALKILAKFPCKLKNVIATPHEGEAAEILGISAELVRCNRFECVVELQRRYGGIWVLKGKNTLIFDGQNCFCCTYGNSGMSSAGMGDLLSGIMGGLLVQKMPLLEAAKAAVLLHSVAAQIETKKYGKLGLLPSDLFSRIRQLLNLWSKN